jgi:sec-independent protein translocase protein TatA
MIMFGIGMPELLVIAVIALLVVGPKRLPDIAKALGKGFSEFRNATESTADTFKETLKPDELKKDRNGFKDSLLYGKEKEEEKKASTAPAAVNVAESEAPKPADSQPQP